MLRARDSRMQGGISKPRRHGRPRHHRPHRVVGCQLPGRARRPRQGVGIRRVAGARHRGLRSPPLARGCEVQGRRVAVLREADQHASRKQGDTIVRLLDPVARQGFGPERAFRGDDRPGRSRPRSADPGFRQRRAPVVLDRARAGRARSPLLGRGAWRASGLQPQPGDRPRDRPQPPDSQPGPPDREVRRSRSTLARQRRAPPSPRGVARGPPPATNARPSPSERRRTQARSSFDPTSTSALPDAPLHRRRERTGARPIAPDPRAWRPLRSRPGMPGPIGSRLLEPTPCPRPNGRRALVLLRDLGSTNGTLLRQRRRRRRGGGGPTPRRPAPDRPPEISRGSRAQRLTRAARRG